MDDVIYRQDAVDELREYITEPSISDDESEIIGYNDGIELAISVLSTMPSAQQWISCEKKMPKAEEKVWIQTQSGKVCFAMYEDGTISECDSNWSWFDIEYSSWDEDKDSGIIPEGWWEFTVFHPDCEFDCPVDEKVVAWMPLPEPYKEDEDDSERYGNATTKRGGHDAESRS